jgi:hypothetical protein
LANDKASDLSFLSPSDGIEITRQGTVKIDPATLMTTASGIFAADDIAFGPRLIISAVAGRAQLLVEAVHVHELLGERWHLAVIIRDKEVLVARVPQSAELFVN